MDGGTVFENGSITKVFTALLLVDMAVHGEVALADPVAKFLPPQGRPCEFDDKAISLFDLVTYTSGLPRMPDNFNPKDSTNLYADYTMVQLYEFVSGDPTTIGGDTIGRSASRAETANGRFTETGKVSAPLLSWPLTETPKEHRPTQASVKM